MVPHASWLATWTGYGDRSPERYSPAKTQDVPETRRRHLSLYRNIIQLFYTTGTIRQILKHLIIDTNETNSTNKDSEQGWKIC